MTAIVWIGLALLVVAVVVFRLLVPSLDSIVDRAAKHGDLSGLVEVIQRRPEAVQPTVYNHAIRRLWDGYQRELAVALIRELARNFGPTRIAQYWLQQVQQVEPKLAIEKLGKEFLDTHYLPELAAQCGPVG